MGGMGPMGGGHDDFGGGGGFPNMFGPGMGGFSGGGPMGGAPLDSPFHTSCDSSAEHQTIAALHVTHVAIRQFHVSCASLIWLVPLTHVHLE